MTLPAPSSSWEILPEGGVQRIDGPGNARRFICERCSSLYAPGPNGARRRFCSQICFGRARHEVCRLRREGRAS